MKIFWHLLLWLWCGHGLATPALWSASKDEQQLWLFGSIHIADDRLAELPPALLQALDEAGLLLLEVDPRTITPTSLAPYLRMPTGESWQSRLGPSLSAELDAAVSQAGLAQLRPLPPWFAALQLTQAKAMALGFAGEQGVDMQMLAHASARQIPIAGLESASTVFGMLASLPARRLEADFVRHSLDELNDMQQHLDRLLDTWLSGDEEALRDLLQEEAGAELKAFIEQELLLSRNRMWLEQLHRLDPPRALLVVGALHLYGEHGLLSLLEQAGYTLNKIEDKALY
ncbi:TraB/GumN family protein [Zobellella iuensis]|uniref:TraB/GumN family protein n=1 Tax=Zobellella iuensis TaxID=2803811 RepID=A0ABS1QRL4_9GAMM|nr:TraB/GumN family protein [Zobellella iuensis]MBL1377514.1 TraB/GumN family protein [Zobellella iuensis]